MRITKIGAFRKLTPDTGSYMNEADWENVHWQKNFYGGNWEKLGKVKAAYDPEGVFCCPACVGSEMWEEKFIRAITVSFTS